MSTATLLIAIVQGWAVIGALVAAAFVVFGMQMIDEDARGAVTFRPLIVPGVILIWPLVLWRWWILARGTDDWHKRHTPPRRVHGPMWIAMGVVLIATLASAYALRQTWPVDVPPVQITAPQEVTQ